MRGLAVNTALQNHDAVPDRYPGFHAIEITGFEQRIGAHGGSFSREVAELIHLLFGTGPQFPIGQGRHAVAFKLLTPGFPTSLSLRNKSDKGTKHEVFRRFILV